MEENNVNENEVNEKTTGKFAEKGKKSGVGFSLPSSIPFSYSVVLFVVFLVVGAGIAAVMVPKTAGPGTSGAAVTSGNLTDEQLKVKVENYLNVNFLSSQGVVGKITSVEPSGSPALLKLNFNILQDGNVVQQGAVFASRDGTDLILGSVLNLNTPLPAADTSGQPADQPAEVQKSDKPKLELFVMAFCPYGVQAEEALSPVAKLLGSAADIEIKFIVNLNGDTPADVVSLHGAGEAAEDLRQICINKLYPEKYWSYLDLIDAGYSAGTVTANNVADKWAAFATSVGIDANAVQSCVQTDAMTIIKQYNTDAKAYGATSSPTFILNGTHASVARTPDGIKTAICDAFNTAPAKCSETLSATGTAATSGCG